MAKVVFHFQHGLKDGNLRSFGLEWPVLAAGSQRCLYLVCTAMSQVAVLEGLEVGSVGVSRFASAMTSKVRSEAAKFSARGSALKSFIWEPPFHIFKWINALPAHCWWGGGIFACQDSIVWLKVRGWQDSVAVILLEMTGFICDWV